ncbi:phosphatase PAP2 family protein [Raoultibacter phocaeensis]|uniref:phosphatase PAP2 family protein n=1 Tax=Raoultibacter phocaeensis TaxID=2479841 RepID=UPI0015D5D4BC|nr:phosphatase PAP2 family protein [Raoultibacter phocaeensis]
MELTAQALWLNMAFGPFDYAVLQVLHHLAEAAGWVLTPFFGLISLIGEKGVVFFILGIVLVVYKKTRVWGLCMLAAVCIGALLTNIILKDLIDRPRPFVDEAGAFYAWWQYVGAPEESGGSFPSGHVTAAAAAMTALVLAGGPRYLWAAVPTVGAMALSRLYFMAHYPSDVIAAMIVGVVAAVLAWLLVRAGWSYHTRRLPSHARTQDAD